MTVLADTFSAAQAVRVENTGAWPHAVSRAYLAAKSAELGVDRATELYFQHICELPENRRLIASVDAQLAAPPSKPPRFQIYIAPGAFYVEQPRFGGDGRTIKAAAAKLGIDTLTIPILSAGSVTHNAGLIAAALQRAPSPVILCSMSKGGAEVRIALERFPALASKVRCWFNICGLIRGTPISDSLLGTAWWQRGLLKGYLAYTRAGPGFVSELAGTPGSLLGRPLSLPAVDVINVVGFPLTSHLAGNSKVRHSRMAHLGPNDGTSLLCDAIVDSGQTYPVWGADHFMRPPGMVELMAKLLAYVEAA